MKKRMYLAPIVENTIMMVQQHLMDISNPQGLKEGGEGSGSGARVPLRNLYI